MSASDSIFSRLADDVKKTSPGEWIQGFAGFAWLSGNLALTILKEDPPFWRNAGGFPPGLRDFTLDFYYPILIGSMAICCALSWRLLWQYSVRFRCSMFSCSSVLVLWCLLFLNCGVLVANNIDNLVEGRPLHYHEKE